MQDFFDIDAGCNLDFNDFDIRDILDAECKLVLPTQDNIYYNPVVVSTTTPFQLLNMYGGKNTQRKQVTKKGTDPPCHDTRSVITILKLARSRLLELSTENPDAFSILSKTHHVAQPQRVIMPFEEEIDLAMALQAAGEQVAKKSFVSARKLLSRCQHSASKTGTPLQRILYYFSKALQQKMDQEWGIMTPKERRKPVQVLQTLNTLQPARISCEQQFSTSLVSQYTSIQSILDNISSAKRVHLIDLRIKTGSHWTVLIQALAVRDEFPIESLKITAVGTSNELMVETGKWLSAFAATMNVPFSYTVVLSDLKEISKEMFQFEADETLAIYSSMCLWSLLPWPNDLKSLINVVKGLNPCLVVINEVNANLSSPDFMERYTNSLLYYGAIFDGLMINFKNHPFRKLMEEELYRDGIRNIITCDGIERTYRHESARFWRALFARCGFVEAELSPSALSQAKLLIDRSANRTRLNLETDGKYLTSGWKGTLLEFVCTWKLPQDC